MVGSLDVRKMHAIERYKCGMSISQMVHMRPSLACLLLQPQGSIDRLQMTQQYCYLLGSTNLDAGPTFVT